MQGRRSPLGAATECEPPELAPGYALPWPTSSGQVALALLHKERRARSTDRFSFCLIGRLPVSRMRSYKAPVCKSFRMSSYKEQGVGGGYIFAANGQILSIAFGTPSLRSFRRATFNSPAQGLPSTCNLCPATFRPAQRAARIPLPRAALRI